MKFRLLSLCFAFSVLAQFASADVVQLGASKDTMIFSGNVSMPGNANQSNGAGGAPGFFAGTDSNATIRRGLLAFNVASIPTNATITSVELRLVIGQAAGGGSFANPVIGLHKLLTPWSEGTTGTSNANNMSGIGQGSPASQGDSTWIATSYDPDPGESVLWNAPGGLAGTDFVSAASASSTLGSATGTVSTWTNTASLMADVQSWVNGSSTNNGWMLINTNETAGQTFRGFYSRDFNPTSGFTPAQVAASMPQLTVTFTPIPEPSTIAVAIVGVGMVGLMMRKRRHCIA